MYATSMNTRIYVCIVLIAMKFFVWCAYVNAIKTIDCRI